MTGSAGEVRDEGGNVTAILDDDDIILDDRLPIALRGGSDSPYTVFELIADLAARVTALEEA